MKDTYVVKTDILKTYDNSFTNEHSNFKSGLCRTFSGGYLYNCSNRTIITMRTNIEKLNNSIDKGYTSINNWLNEYIDDNNNLEKSLVNGSVIGVNDYYTNLYLSKFVGLLKDNIQECSSAINHEIISTEDIVNSKNQGKDEIYSKLNGLSDDELAIIRANLGLAEVGQTNKTIEELIKELSEKTGKDYSSSSNEQIVLLCSTNGIDINRNKTRDESLLEIIDKIGDDYSSLEEFIDIGNQTGFNIYRTHKKGSMFNYSAINSMDDYEFKRLCKELNINASDKDMSYVDMVDALRDKGVKIYTGEKSLDELKQLCEQNGIDVKGGKSRNELEQLVSEKLESKEINQYFGITPTSEEEKQKYIEYESRVDYSKYENLSDEELKKLAYNKNINSEIYTRTGLIKELAERDWNIYRSYGNNYENLDMSAATHDAWDEGYSSIEERAEASKAKVQLAEEVKKEGELYGRTWEYFCLYNDQSGFYRNYANTNELDAEKRSELMVLAHKGVTDKEILDRKILGIDNRKGWDKFIGTVVDFGISFGEGVSSAAEATIDGIDFIATTTYNYWANQVFDDDDEAYNENIKNMEQRIAVDYTREGYDEYVYGSDFGQWVAEKSVDHDTVRGLGNLSGDIAFNVLTMTGVSKMANATRIVSMGTKVTKAARVSNVVAKAITVTPTYITGFGQGLQQGFAAGGSGADVLKAAGIKGALNTLQFGIAGGVTSATVRYAPFDRIFINVMVDTGLGATAVPGDSAIQTIYAKGYTDSSGEYHEFTDDMSWGDKYAALFEQNGGIEKTFETMVTAGAISFGFHSVAAAKESYNNKFNQKNKGQVVEDGIFGADKVEMEGPSTEPVKKINTNTEPIPKSLTEPNAKTSLESQIERVNSEGAGEPIRIKSMDDINTSDLAKLSDPQNVKFQLEDGSIHSYKEVLDYQVQKFNTEVNAKPLTLEQQIERTNIEGTKEPVKIKSMDDITLEDLGKLKNPQDVKFQLEDGSVHSYKEVLDHQVQKMIDELPIKRPSVESQIEKVNDGSTDPIRIKSMDDVDLADLRKLKNPQDVKFELEDGSVHSYKEVLDHQYRKLEAEPSLKPKSEFKPLSAEEQAKYDSNKEVINKQLEKLGYKDYEIAELTKDVNPENYMEYVKDLYTRRNNFDTKYDAIVEEMGKMKYSKRMIKEYCDGLNEKNIADSYNTIVKQKAEFDQKVSILKSYSKELGVELTDESTYIKGTNIHNIDSRIKEYKQRIKTYEGNRVFLRETLSNMGYNQLDIDNMLSLTDESNIMYKISKARYNTELMKIKQAYVEQSMKVLGANEEFINNYMRDFNVYTADSMYNNAQSSVRSNIRNIFKRFSEYDSYGVDQGLMQRMYEYKDANGKIISEREFQTLSPADRAKYEKGATSEYFRIKDVIKSKGFSNRDASLILRSIDNEGACSYAATANEIFVKYASDPIKFYNDFGFPMYTYIDGKYCFNSAELLVDMYVHVNTIENGGMLFHNSNGTSGVNTYFNGEVMSEKQFTLSDSGGKRVDLINGYLKSKNSSLEYTSYDLMNSKYQGSRIFKPEYTINEIKSYSSTVDRCIKDGNLCSLGVYGGENYKKLIKMYSLDGRKTEIFDQGGHAMFITEVRSDGYVVSSWGNEYLVPFDELADGSSFVINVSSIIN